jgi:hypothetical protein
MVDHNKSLKSVMPLDWGLEVRPTQKSILRVNDAKHNSGYSKILYINEKTEINLEYSLNKQESSWN